MPKWVIVNFGKFYENYRSSPHFWELIFSAVKGYGLFLTKNGFGYTLGDFVLKLVRSQ
jgi:hypothetical protein